MAGRLGRRGFGAIRKLASGRYQATYIGPDRERHASPVTFRTKDSAVVWLTAEQRLMEAAHAGGPAWRSPADRAREELLAARAKERRTTFERYATAWIENRRNGRGEPLRALTRKDYEQSLRDYLIPAFGRMALQEISKADVRRWHAKFDATKPRARTKAYGLLRAVMNSAVDDDLIAVSPVHIRGAGAVVKRRDVEPATPEQIDVMARNMPARLAAAVPLSAWCALRYGELAELRRQDIDVTNRVVKVRRAVTFPEGGPVVGPPKSEAGVRDVAIPPHVWPTVEAHLRDHVKQPQDSLLFGTLAGRHLWHSGMRLTPIPGQVVVWSGGFGGRLVGLSGQVVFVL